eukprot:755646-Hanusia_phi.AAC.1
MGGGRPDLKVCEVGGEGGREAIRGIPSTASMARGRQAGIATRGKKGGGAKAAASKDSLLSSCLLVLHCPASPPYFLSYFFSLPFTKQGPGSGGG